MTDSPSIAKKIRHRTSVVCVHDGKLLTFHAVDPTSKTEYLFLPGGMIEPGEATIRCAQRETLEETGYHVCINPESQLETHYDFQWDGRIGHCHTYFFRAALAQEFFAPGKVQDADYNIGVVWLPLSEIADRMNYHPVILEAVQRLIANESATVVLPL